jgi:hypothetical protein
VELQGHVEKIFDERKIKTEVFTNNQQMQIKETEEVASCL